MAADAGGDASAHAEADGQTALAAELGLLFLLLCSAVHALWYELRLHHACRRSNVPRALGDPSHAASLAAGLAAGAVLQLLLAATCGGVDYAPKLALGARRVPFALSALWAVSLYAASALGRKLLPQGGALERAVAEGVAMLLLELGVEPAAAATALWRTRCAGDVFATPLAAPLTWLVVGAAHAAAQVQLRRRLERLAAAPRRDAMLRCALPFAAAAVALGAAGVTLVLWSVVVGSDFAPGVLESSPSTTQSAARWVFFLVLAIPSGARLLWLARGGALHTRHALNREMSWTLTTPFFLHLFFAFSLAAAHSDADTARRLPIGALAGVVTVLSLALHLLPALTDLRLRCASRRLLESQVSGSGDDGVEIAHTILRDNTQVEELDRRALDAARFGLVDDDGDVEWEAARAARRGGSDGFVEDEEEDEDEDAFAERPVRAPHIDASEERKQPEPRRGHQ